MNDKIKEELFSAGTDRELPTFAAHLFLFLPLFGLRIPFLKICISKPEEFCHNQLHGVHYKAFGEDLGFDSFHSLVSHLLVIRGLILER